MSDKIQIIDFSGYGLDVKDSKTVQKETINAIAEQMREAMKDVGFCYLKNHGFNLNIVDKYKAVSRQFFEQPIEERQKFKRGSVSFGWLGIGREIVNPDRPHDLKEVFNYCPQYDPGNWGTWRSFQEANQNFFAEGAELSYRFCDVLSLSLGWDMDCMRKYHSLIGQKNNMSTIRATYYPPLPPTSEVKPNQMRLGEHIDFGTFTLLFIDDDIGGLEVDLPGIGYVPVDPIPGTIIVNIGEVGQRFAADRIVGDKHRVAIPEEEAQRKIVRQTVGFFVQPDDDCVISCIDGSDKYAPISAPDLLKDQFEKLLNPSSHNTSVSK